jgi:hypothetical protein
VEGLELLRRELAGLHNLRFATDKTWHHFAGISFGHRFYGNPTGMDTTPAALFIPREHIRPSRKNFVQRAQTLFFRMR